jgi:transposase
MSMSEREPMPEPARRMEVFTGVGRRRTWSSDEKAAIVTESCVGDDGLCRCAPSWTDAAAALPLASAGPSCSYGRSAGDVRTGGRGDRTFGGGRHACALASGSAALQGERDRAEIDDVTVRVGTDANPRAIAAAIRALKTSS